MSILVNLLPDVRQAKLRERRRRQVVSGVSILVWVICGAVVTLMSIYAAGQKVVINNYSGNISKEEKQLQTVPNLLDAYTAEQHLAALPGLYNQRVYMTKFLTAYSQADPTDATLSSLTVDAQNNLVLQGVAKTYASVAKLARAMTASGGGYFSSVAITSVSNTGGQVSFTINATVATGGANGGQ